MKEVGIDEEMDAMAGLGGCIHSAPDLKGAPTHDDGARKSSPNPMTCPSPASYDVTCLLLSFTVRTFSSDVFTSIFRGFADSLIGIVTLSTPLA